MRISKAGLALALVLIAPVPGVAAEAPPPAPALAASAAADSPAMADALAITEMSGVPQAMTQMLETLGPLMAQAVMGGLTKNAKTATLVTLLDERYEGGSTAFADEFVRRVKQQFGTRMPEMLRLTAQEYTARISPADLSELHRMVATPAYQAMVRVSPEIQLAMAAHGQVIGQEIAEQVMRDFLGETLAKMKLDGTK